MIPYVPYRPDYNAIKIAIVQTACEMFKPDGDLQMKIHVYLMGVRIQIFRPDPRIEPRDEHLLGETVHCDLQAGGMDTVLLLTRAKLARVLKRMEKKEAA